MLTASSRKHRSTATGAGRKSRTPLASDWIVPSGCLMRTRITACMVLIVLLSACGQNETADTTTTSVEQPTTTPSVEQPTTTDTLPVFPPQRENVEHGGSTWAAVLAAARAEDDPAISAAVQAARDAGYDVGLTDCDEGAAEAFGQPDARYTVSVYFDTEADARTAGLAFEARNIDAVVAEVRTFCLD